jgi:hypothetical protein
MGAISAARSAALMAWIGVSLCVLGSGAFAFPYTFSYNYMQPKEGTAPNYQWHGTVSKQHLTIRLFP